MSVGVFTDRNHKPTEAEVTKAVGPMWPSWRALIEHIRANYPGQEEFKFCYGKKYGWALRFRAKGALLTALYPAEDSFTAQIILSRSALQPTRAVSSETAQQAIARAKPYPEGKWLFVPVESDQDVRGVQQLLALKMGTAPQKKAAGA